MLEVIGNSVVASPLTGYKIPPIAKRNFTPAFTVSMMAKDFDLALAASQNLVPCCQPRLWSANFWAFFNLLVG